MTSFIRFFILALPPLLGVTLYAGSALLFSAVMLAVMLSASLLRQLTVGKLADGPFFWVVLAQSVVLITIIDLLATVFAPPLRASWGIYLNLLALSPLVLVLSVEQRIPARTAILLFTLITAMGLVREVFGLGTLSLIPDVVFWKVPFFHEFPLTILATTAGAFFLASASVVFYRLLGPLVPLLIQEPARIPLTAPVPDAALVAPVVPDVERRSRPRPEGSDAEWGDTLEDLASRLTDDKPHVRKRLLVIGSGNGELVYYLAMLCLEERKSAKGFQFRVSGIDHFSTRVETSVKGIYRDNLLEYIPDFLRETWMTRGKDDRSLLRVANEPRLHIQFEVADLTTGTLILGQEAHLTVLNQDVSVLSAEKRQLFFRQIADNLVPGGALVILCPFPRESIPEGMKRTGRTVFVKKFSTNHE